MSLATTQGTQKAQAAPFSVNRVTGFVPLSSQRFARPLPPFRLLRIPAQMRPFHQPFPVAMRFRSAWSVLPCGMVVEPCAYVAPWLLIALAFAVGCSSSSHGLHLLLAQQGRVNARLADAG